jgi:uncharacterized protein YbcC (UPF0753/DUF2309 family)
MSTTLSAPANIPPALGSQIEQALQRIPPLWPLTHFVAVNPFVGLLDRPFAEASAVLQRTAGAAPLQSPSAYLEAFRQGRIAREDLAAVAGSKFSVDALLAALADPDTAVETTPVSTVADLLDAERPRAHWSVFVAEEISKWCAVTFDVNQTTWQSPWRRAPLFSGWREAACHDRNPEAFGLRGFRAFVASLPNDAEATIAHCLQTIAPPEVDPVDFLHRQLLGISGWASFVQYLVREDNLRGRENGALRDLLAIRLAYDAALFAAFGRDGVFRANWRNQQNPATDERRLAVLVCWQNAYERGYQRSLARALAKPPTQRSAARPAFQAIFCIDVRSEVFRRHLEAAAPSAQTLGFAGFFGLAVAHRRAGEGHDRARCPVLLVPPVESTEPLTETEATVLNARRAASGAWKAFQNSAASCFSFVESAGLAYGVELGSRGRTRGPSCSRSAPSLENLPPDKKADLAEGALKNMSLRSGFARLVLVCGHGSVSANNPYASALDCGACGGHAGDVNARLAVGILNDRSVRARLATRGLLIPDDTVFVAGLHTTTTDDVVLFETESVPSTHKTDLTALTAALATAGAAARLERAPSLGIDRRDQAGVDQAIRDRASDIAQTRPEWGLANNAAFVAAPRARTRGLNLEGRVFLHDYDATADADDAVLTLILSAPVVVASWINLQYYASRVDPARYGAGNKVLHNIAGGLGAMEGNGGDLKVGLPLQSIHDGTRFIHEPRRLSVFIEAAPGRIDAVLAAKPAVRLLFDHGWISLHAVQGETVFRYDDGRWTPAD